MACFKLFIKRIYNLLERLNMRSKLNIVIYKGVHRHIKYFGNGICYNGNFFLCLVRKMNIFIVHFLCDLADIKRVVAYSLKVTYAVEHAGY